MEGMLKRDLDLRPKVPTKTGSPCFERLPLCTCYSATATPQTKPCGTNCWHGSAAAGSLFDHTIKLLTYCLCGN
jgi:hypothetical protein